MIDIFICLYYICVCNLEILINIFTISILARFYSQVKTAYGNMIYKSEQKKIENKVIYVYIYIYIH